MRGNIWCCRPLIEQEFKHADSTSKKHLKLLFLY